MLRAACDGAQRYATIDIALESFASKFTLICSQFWANRRWVDPTDPQDLYMMSDRLSRAQRLVPELQQCSIDLLQAVVAQIHSPSDPCGDERDSDSSSESEPAEPAPAERPATGPGQLPPLSAFCSSGLRASPPRREVRLAIRASAFLAASLSSRFISCGGTHARTSSRSSLALSPLS